MSDRTPRQLEMAAHARRYRAMGLNPLPSRADVKRPAMKAYAAERDGGIPDWMLDKWWGENIQICLGVRWGLVAVDLDGPEAVRVWRSWSRALGVPRTWSVERDASAGRHHWFRPPAGVTTVATTVLWGVRNAAGGWAKGSKVELLGDASLVIAPPSRHVRTGQPYRWVVGPDDLPAPAELPGWVLGLARRPAVATVASRPIAYRPSAPSARRHHDKAAVMAALGPETKVLLAKQFGVRFASERWDGRGWCRCHRDGEDSNPSASFNVFTGYLNAPQQGFRSSLFELGVRAGAYPDLCAAIDALGDFAGVAHRRDAS